jgi:hypothetical protein
MIPEPGQAYRKVAGPQRRYWPSAISESVCA